jgi:superfamily I DNA and/or RNA helicase
MAGRLPWNSADRVRVITFYSEQVAEIKRMLVKANLSGVTVATVDSSQGSEADLVIVSFVRSKGSTQKDSIGFLSDDRRLNVALTRARYQLVCVGNIHGSLRTAPKGAIKDLIAWSVELGHTINLYG